MLLLLTLNRSKEKSLACFVSKGSISHIFPLVNVIKNLDLTPLTFVKSVGSTPLLVVLTYI